MMIEESSFPLAILETIQEPVQVMDRAFTIVWCNSYCVDNKTYGPEQLVGRVCFEVFFQRRTPCPDCPLEGVFESGRGQVRDKMIPMPDGSVQWRQVHSYPLNGPDGHPAFLVKIGFDVTERKREQGRMKKYMENLENAIAGQPLEVPGDQEAVSLAKERYRLTQRELEVLGLLAKGFTNAQIAGILNISPHTSKTHVGHIFDKLGVGDRAQAAAWAARMRLA